MSLAGATYHAHLDACRQCREHPFALCPVGAAALAADALAPEPASGTEAATACPPACSPAWHTYSSALVVWAEARAAYLANGPREAWEKARLALVAADTDLHAAIAAHAAAAVAAEREACARLVARRAAAESRSGREAGRAREQTLQDAAAAIRARGQR